MYVSINKGGNPPNFVYLGNVKSAEATQAFVRLGDIDGDGRLDYCVFKGTGSLYCWRNGGTGDVPVWEPMTGGDVVYDTTSLGDIAGIRLVDINGDFRSDIISMDSTGKTRIFINQRGTKEDGAGLKPHWIEASAAHGGGFADRTVDYFKFGRIYGSGRADYIVLKETNVKDSLGWKHTYDFAVYKNTGSGGRKVKGVSEFVAVLRLCFLTNNRMVFTIATCLVEATTTTYSSTRLETSTFSKTPANFPIGKGTTRFSTSAAIERASTSEIGMAMDSATS